MRVHVLPASPRLAGSASPSHRALWLGGRAGRRCPCREDLRRSLGKEAATRQCLMACAPADPGIRAGVFDSRHRGKGNASRPRTIRQACCRSAPCARPPFATHHTNAQRFRSVRANPVGDAQKNVYAARLCGPCWHAVRKHACHLSCVVQTSMRPPARWRRINGNSVGARLRAIDVRDRATGPAVPREKMSRAGRAPTSFFRTMRCRWGGVGGCRF
jgi:hypothetical protein